MHLTVESILKKKENKSLLCLESNTLWHLTSNSGTPSWGQKSQFEGLSRIISYHLTIKILSWLFMDSYWQILLPHTSFLPTMFNSTKNQTVTRHFQISYLIGFLFPNYLGGYLFFHLQMTAKAPRKSNLPKVKVTQLASCKVRAHTQISLTPKSILFVVPHSSLSS